MSAFGQGNINVNISGNAQGLVTAMNQAQQSTTKTMTTIQQQTTKTASFTDKLSNAFAGNRGLIYSFGTIFGTMTGVVAEFQLLEDAQGQVGEATEKLNQLTAEGKQGTTQYTQAQQQLEKAQRFLSFTTRNLALAVTNFVPEILLLATNLAKAKVGADSAAKGIQVLSAGQKALVAETTVANSVVKLQQAGLAATIVPLGQMQKGVQGLTAAEVAMGVEAKVAGTAMKSALIGTGIGAAIVAAGTALVAFVENWGNFRDIVNQAGQALGNFLPILKGILTPMGQFGDWLAETLGNKAKKGTDEAAKEFKGLSKEAQQAAEDVQKAWDQTIDDLVDKTGSERRKILENLGFGKSGIKTIKIGIEIADDAKDIADRLSQSLGFIKKFPIPEKALKDWSNNFVDFAQKKIKDAGGKLDFLQPLIDIIEKNKKNPDLPKIVAQWFDKLPNEMKLKLKEMGIDVQEDILTPMGFTSEELNAGINKAISGTSIDWSKMFVKNLHGPTNVKRELTAKGGSGGLVDQFINSITQGLKTGFSPEKMKDIGATIGNAIVGAVTFTANALGPLFKLFVDTLKPLATPAGMAGLGQAISAAIVDSVKWTTDVVKNLVIGLGIALAPLFKPESLGPIGQAFQDAFVDSVKWTAEAVKNIVIGLGIELAKLFKPESLAPVGKALMDAIIGAAQLIGNLSAKFATWLAGKLGEIFTPKNLAAAGKLLMDGLIGAAQLIGNLSADFAKWLSGKLGEIFTSKNLIDAGTAFVNGLIDAIKSVPDIAGKIFNALKDAITGGGGGGISKPFGEFTVPPEHQFPQKGGLGQPTLQGVAFTTGGTGGTGGKGDPNLDVFSRQLVTITQNVAKLVAAYNLLARATVVVGTDTQKVVAINNSYARTIATVTQDANAQVKANNSLARTLVTVSSDTDGGTKSNNSYARTIVTVTKDVSAWTKANNTLARTIVEVTKDVGSAIKQNNTFARTLVTVGKDAASAAKDVKSLASAINSLKSKTVTVTTVKKVVTQGAADATLSDSNISGGNAHTDMGTLNVTLINTDEFSQAKLKKFKASLGKQSYRFM